MFFKESVFYTKNIKGYERELKKSINELKKERFYYIRKGYEIICENIELFSKKFLILLYFVAVDKFLRNKGLNLKKKFFLSAVQCFINICILYRPKKIAFFLINIK